jgi:hypothetical protein
MQPLDSTIRGGSKEAPVTSCIHRGRGQPYQFQRDVSDPLCLVCAILYRPVLRRSLYIALVVGTILAIINQGDVLLLEAITPLAVAKILLTHAVPYSVSIFSALSANRVKETLKELNRI